MNINLTNIKNKHQCQYCDKIYSRKNSLINHLILCEITHKSNNDKKIEEEESEDIPNYSQLVKIVLELTKKCNKLEESLEKMKVWVENKKKKINIISWLNTSYKSELSFEDWINKLEITSVNLDYLFHNTIINTIVNIFENNLKSNDNIKYPIVCFTQKNNVFYINKNNGEETNWIQISLEDIVKILKKIQNTLISLLMKWKETNLKNKTIDSEQIDDIFNKTIIKLMDISFHQDASMGKIKTGLYNYLKVDLKNMIEYEFEF